MKIRRIQKGIYAVSGVNLEGTIGDHRVVCARTAKEALKVARKLNKKYWSCGNENNIYV